MKVLITGANGFIGYYLVHRLLSLGHTVIATGRGECRLPFGKEERFTYLTMDFTDPFSVHDVFYQTRPDAVVHAGAMSKPDECEQHQWQAYLVNVEGTVTTMLNAAEQKSFFVFLSTDFVFDGDKGMYSENDPYGPVNYYGKTKVEAEEIVKEYESGWAIVRTVMVYGKPVLSRSNLLSTVREKLEKGETYNVFNDQLRTPTYVEDLVEGIVRILVNKTTGIFHISGKDVMTPYEMAIAVAEHLGLDKSLLRKVIAADFPQPARRPVYTGLSIEKARTELGYGPLSFEEGLRKTLT